MRLVARIGDLAAEIGSHMRTVPSKSRISTVPFKSNAARRHHIPKQRYRVTNWSEYDAALRQQGSLTVWFSDEAIAAWRAEPRTTRGGQPHYSALAIRTALTLRVVFRLALRRAVPGKSESNLDLRLDCSSVSKISIAAPNAAVASATRS
jgi:hypothetical protein